MRKLKVILSVVLALVMLSTSFAFSTMVSAADVKTSETGQETNLQSNIEDGCILHALCWSYSEIEKNLPAIAAAGYSAIQTSPVQQPKDYSTSTNVSGQWWKFYQPVSFSIADKSWAGTSAQLTSLCEAAHKYGIKIVCDIVSNHLGASSELQDPRSLADEIKKYERDIWYGSSDSNDTYGFARNNMYFHQDFSDATDGSNVTTGIVTGCPDLNTADSYVQSRVVSLLKSCVDCGVDGFRFDAAKHIETDSDYWTNILSQTNSYASQKGKTMFYYGEVLNSVGNNRPSTSYTNLNGGKFRITDNKASKTIREAVTGHNASAAMNASFPVAGSADKAVLWAESHDTYLGNKDSEITTSVSDEDIVKAWALVASRKGSTPLYFARTNNMHMGGAAFNTNYKSVAVAEVNKFHNNAGDNSEKLGSSGNIAYVARANTGIVLVNVNGTTASVNISGTGLSDGQYTDMVTGNQFTISGGTVSGDIGSTGVAVVMQSTTTPSVFASKESQTFEGESITTQLTLSNAVSGTYQLDDYEPVTFTGSPTIRLGSDYSYGSTFTLTLTATDGVKEATAKYTYTKKKAASSNVYVILPESLVKNQNWVTPVYCYVYDEVSKNTYPKYANDAWPGEEMKYDATNKVYYVEVHSDSCYKQTSKDEPAVADSYNLVESERTRVIISDSAKSAGGLSQGNKFPAGDTAPGFKLNKTTHTYTQLYGAESSAWTTSDMTPGKEQPVPATEVVQGDVQPTQSTQQTNPTSGEKRYYGDADLSGDININDVTTIQLHLVETKVITNALALELADVTNDGRVSIQDANYIQRALAGFSETGRTGTECTQTVPTQASQSTQPTQAPPAGTFTLYAKTTLSWISSSGAEPYVKDNSTGISYLMVKDYDAYPEVFTAEVPDTISSVTFYRATAPTAVHYNTVTGLTVSKTNNCIELTQPDSDLVGTTKPYVAESAPSFTLNRVYAYNDAHWSKVYLYGWSYGINEETLEMTNISGTDYWYVDLPQPAVAGYSYFKFKDTEGKTSWVNQTSQNITIEDPYNCYTVSNGDGRVFTISIN